MSHDASHVNRFVGKNKSKNSRAQSSTGVRESQDDLLSHLKEFEEWANPAFNVLVVQTPRPAFLEAPILTGFRDAVKGTGVSCMHAEGCKHGGSLHGQT